MWQISKMGSVSMLPKGKKSLPLQSKKKLKKQAELIQNN